MGLWESFIQSRRAAEKNKIEAAQLRWDKQLASAASSGTWDKAEEAIAQGARSGELINGHSALFWAAKTNNLPMIERLIPRAAWGEEAHGQNALMAACFEGHLEAAMLIAKKMPASALGKRDEFGASALGFAANSGSEALVEGLLSLNASGHAFGKNMRWQAASIAAADRNPEMVELLAKEGWESDSDQAEDWEANSWRESLAICALSKKSTPAATQNKIFNSLGDWDGCDMTLLAMMSGAKPTHQGEPPVLTIHPSKKSVDNLVDCLGRLIAADLAAGTPPKEEGWATQTIQMAINRYESASGEFIVDRFPAVATETTWSGDTALMLAMDNGMSSLCDKLAPLSDLSAIGSDGRSTLRRSIRRAGKHSVTNSLAFASLAKIVPQQLWDEEEEAVWRDILGPGQPHWGDQDLMLAATAAASRSSQKSLSMALTIAVEEDREQIADFLFPLTNSEMNEAAFAQAFLRRCLKSGGMSALVARRTAVLQEAEAIEGAARELPVSTRAPAKRL